MDPTRLKVTNWRDIIVTECACVWSFHRFPNFTICDDRFWSVQLFVTQHLLDKCRHCWTVTQWKLAIIFTFYCLTVVSAWCNWNSTVHLTITRKFHSAQIDSLFTEFIRMKYLRNIFINNAIPILCRGFQCFI